MKNKVVVSIGILILLFGIGFGELSQYSVDKKAMQPGKPNAADLITVSNSFYDLIVENVTNNNGIGTYTVRTGTSHPATISMGSKQNVLYGGTSSNPWSSYLSVKSYTSNTIYHTGDGTYTPDPGCTAMQLDWTSTSVTQPTSNSVVCVWNVIGENDFLRIKQNTFIDGATLDDSKIGVTTTVKNTGYDTVRIGIRYEWDIMIDGNDAARYRTKNPEGPWLTYETQWGTFNYTHYEITDYPFGTPTFYNLGSATGPTYLTPPPTPPDLLQYAGWSNSYSRAFNYTLQGVNLSFTDSAILYYWGDNLANAKVLAPGDSVMVTQYLFASLLSLNYQPDNQIKNMSSAYLGNGIYNLTAQGQTIDQYTTVDNPSVFNIKIENDGTGQDGFTVREYLPTEADNVTDSRTGWTVQYFDALAGGNNITAQITGSGWSTGSLNQGQSREIRMEATPDVTAPSGTPYVKYVMSTSANDNTKKDVVCGQSHVETYYDCGPIQILAPTGNITTGTNVTPKVIVKNLGNASLTPFPVTLSFGAYSQTVNSTLLSPTQVDTVVFPSFTAVTGNYNTITYTAMTLDQNRTNDTLRGSFTVTSTNIYDVGATQILAPLGVIVSGTNVTPKAVIQNFGNTGAEGTVYFQFGSYSSSRSFMLTAGQIDTVDFDVWNAVAGSYLERAFTVYSLDQNVHNDTVYNEFMVSPATIHDVGATQILTPISNINVGTIVAPKAVVYNFGNVNETSVPVYFTFGSYSSMRTVNLVVGQYDTITFDNWTATAGSYMGIAYTALSNDQNRVNDTARYRFTVIETSTNDISLDSVIVPSGSVTACNNYTPSVLVYNPSNSPRSCSVYVRITRYPSRMMSYCNVVIDTNRPIVLYEVRISAILAAGYNTVHLTNWHPYWWDLSWTASPTYHTVYGMVSSPNDSNLNNNSIMNNFYVTGPSHDLALNWTGLLNGYQAVPRDTLEIRAYNVASVVSNSHLGPALPYRVRVKITKLDDNMIVYQRYLDQLINPMSYACHSFPTGFTPSEPGWYRIQSWLETRPGDDMISENNSAEHLYYFVEFMSYSNNANITQTTQGNHSNGPQTFEISANRPNPFSQSTQIQWQIPMTGNVQISVYNAAGQIVKTLVNGRYAPGYYAINWNRTNDLNQRVSSGIYFYEMKSDNYVARRKMIITQ